MQMNDLEYIIKPRAAQKIYTFYRNVAKKYRHTYDKDDLKRDAHHAVFSIYQIEYTPPRRVPTIARWAGYHMANTNKWYFAYIIKGNTIIVVDACHTQNMHNN